MALTRIPLTHFLDRSDRFRPKGLIRPAGPLIINEDGSPGPSVPFGLISAMRNPMVDSPSPYGDFLVMDFRPCDNWTISRNTEEVRGTTVTVVQPTEHGYLHADADGAYIKEIDSGKFGTNQASLDVNNENDNGYFDVDAKGDGRRVAVMLAAIRVIELKPSSGASLGRNPFGYYSGGSRALFGELLHTKDANSFQAALYTRAGLGTDAAPLPVPNETLSHITSESLGQWILLQVVKDDVNNVTVRLAGGQFGDDPTVNSRTEGFDPGVSADEGGPIEVWAANNFRLPCRRQARLGFATLAQYTASAGPPVDPEQITWEVFDDEHTCNNYVITGTRIEFDCTNEVSWEVGTPTNWYQQIPDGSWVVSGSQPDRKFYSGASQIVDYSPGFLAIRPVLRNTGLLKSETLAVLHMVKAGTP